MIEQYVFTRITANPALQTLLSAGGGKYHLYPAVIPRGITFDRAVTFTTIITNDGYPAIKSVNAQFNIFAKKHSDVAAIASALSDLFNGEDNQTAGGINVVFSIRSSESDLGFDYDMNLYQREATYYYKIR